jgi:hypothetical protein
MDLTGRDKNSISSLTVVKDTKAETLYHQSVSAFSAFCEK